MNAADSHRFLAALGHEIRTPLNAVIGLAGLLADSKLTDEQRDMAQTICASGEQLLVLFNQLLDYERLGSGGAGIELDQEPFHLAESVRETLEMAARAARAKKLSLNLDISAELPMRVVGDAARLRQVLLSYLENAIRCSARGAIDVSVRARGRGERTIDIEFAIRDAAAVGERQREHLGLALARRLTERMGGSSSFELQADTATVRFSIRAGAAAQSTAAPAAIAATAEMALRWPLRILVAEDNPTNLKLMKLVLEGLGYSPDFAVNGVEVLAALRRQPYDLVLMDVRMPEMDGIEATRRIRKEWSDGERPRIVALTAGVLPEERRVCLEAGVDEFMVKPAVRSELLDALRRCQPLVLRDEAV